MKKNLLLILILVLTMIIFVGCGTTNSTSSTPVSRGYTGSAAKGDLVTLDMNPDGTFSFENSTISLSVTGVYNTYSVPGLGVDCYKGSQLIVDDTPVTQTVFFKELPEIALVAYVPDGIGGQEVAVFVYDEAPNLNGPLNGDYHYLDIITSNVSTASTEIGLYSLSGSSAAVSVNSFSSPNNTTYSNPNMPLAISGGYISVSGTSTNVAVAPLGVMVIDHGVNNGMAVGNKVPPSSYGDDDVIGSYFGLSASGKSLFKVEVISSVNMNVQVLDIYTLSPTYRSTHIFNNRTITEIKPGLYECDLGLADNNLLGGYNFGKVIWTINSQGTFFGITGDDTLNVGMCFDNILGLKI